MQECLRQVRGGSVCRLLRSRYLSVNYAASVTKIGCRSLFSAGISGPSDRDTEYVTSACDEATGALIPPLHFSTTYERDSQGELSRGYMYSRVGNPTRNQFEDTFTQLEKGGGESLAFSSGMQAATSLLMACPGAHVVLPDDLYHGVSELDWSTWYNGYDVVMWCFTVI
jgi:cystathionine beta-lyase/cystathionine gamma-synthase